MAIFGDVGRLFGLGTAGETATSAARALGVTNPLTLGAIGSSAQKASEFVSVDSDVSAPPAGVDSPATLSPLSQTSQTDMTFRIPPSGQGFGMNQAFLGGFGLPGIASSAVGAATRALSRPGVGGLVGGLGAGAVVDFFIDQFGQQKKLVITRKMQRDVKKLFMMSGGDFNMTAELYRMATGRSITGEQVVKIITKTFKNQGPYVTKAAVRKTRSTIRKMETLCDLKDRLCPPKRAAPRRRTMGSTTKVLQVK